MTPPARDRAAAAMLARWHHRTEGRADCEVFRTRGHAPGWPVGELPHGAMAMDQLPPFLRTLLVTDGTVTKTLEAFCWEPVKVVDVSQCVVPAGAPIPWLAVDGAEPVLARWVRLRGMATGRHYASAFSIVRLQPVPEGVRHQLLQGKIGIGELIRACGLETYRDILEIGTTTDLSLSGGYDEPPQDCVFRTYRIGLGGQPALLVNECFPLGAYA